MTEVSSFIQSRDKTTGPAEAAMMILYSGKKCEEPLIEPLELTTLAFHKLAKIQPHQQHWTIAINIRTGQWANAFDLHGGFAFQLHMCKRHCQMSCQQRYQKLCREH